MPWWRGTAVSAGAFGIDGNDAWFRPGLSLATSAFHTPSLPSNVYAMDTPGSNVTYRNRRYLVGRYTDNLTFDEFYRIHRLGIRPPDSTSAIAAGSGTGITASEVTGYVTFYDSLTGERSSLSGPTNTISLANKDIDWSGLPTSSIDARVDHVELWRTVDGGGIRLAVRRQLGVATATENVATLGLGELWVETFTRFPRCFMNALYKDRLVVAGDAENPDVLYLSQKFFPERYAGLSFRTLRGEPITGLVNVREMLLVLCPESSYVLQGYDEDDMSLVLSEPELGGWHRAVAMIHGNAWIPNHKNFYVFNGAWSPLMNDGQREYRKAFDDDRLAFEQGYGEHNPIENAYTFKINPTLGTPGDPAAFLLLRKTVTAEDIPNPNDLTINTFGWSADYTPAVTEVGGGFGQPNWTFFVRARKDQCSALMAVPGGKRRDLYTGDCEGFVRKENVDTDADDDADSYMKAFSIRTPHYFMGDPGGDDDAGHELTGLWSYVEAENNTWQLRVLGGDEDAYRQAWYKSDATATEVYLDNVAASANLDYDPGDGGLYDAVAKSRHVHHGPEKAVGHGFTFSVYAESPIKMKFRGIGGTYGPGVARRGYVKADIE